MLREVSGVLFQGRHPDFVRTQISIMGSGTRQLEGILRMLREVSGVSFQGRHPDFVRSQSRRFILSLLQDGVGSGASIRKNEKLQEAQADILNARRCEPAFLPVRCFLTARKATCRKAEFFKQVSSPRRVDLTRIERHRRIACECSPEKARIGLKDW